jgi:hypothetical protein
MPVPGDALGVVKRALRPLMQGPAKPDTGEWFRLRATAPADTTGVGKEVVGLRGLGVDDGRHMNAKGDSVLVRSPSRCLCYWL